MKRIAQLIALSFMSSMVLGPLFVGYLNDRANKKLACLFYGLSLITTIISQMVKKNINILFFSQICLGVSSSVLFTSFENWLVSEAKSTIKDGRVLNFILSSTFER